MECELQDLYDQLDELLENATEYDLDVDKLNTILARMDELDPFPFTEADIKAGLARLHELLLQQEGGGSPSD